MEIFPWVLQLGMRSNKSSNHYPARVANEKLKIKNTPQQWNPNTKTKPTIVTQNNHNNAALSQEWSRKKLSNKNTNKPSSIHQDIDIFTKTDTTDPFHYSSTEEQPSNPNSDKLYQLNHFLISQVRGLKGYSTMSTGLFWPSRAFKDIRLLIYHSTQIFLMQF